MLIMETPQEFNLDECFDEAGVFYYNFGTDDTSGENCFGHNLPQIIPTVKTTADFQRIRNSIFVVVTFNSPK